MWGEPFGGYDMATLGKDGVTWTRGRLTVGLRKVGRDIVSGWQGL